MRALVLSLALLVFSSIAGAQKKDGKPKIVIGSKNFTENYILAEILAQKIEATGKFDVERRFGLGGTGILFEALHSGNIDVYPEYTGTIRAAFLKDQTAPTFEELRQAMRDRGFDVSRSIGFNNTYALAMTRPNASFLKIETIEDLKKHPDIQIAFSHEFLKRDDGLPGLSKAYGLNLTNVRGIEHALAYDALRANQIQVTDIYSTDGKISSYDLQILKDNRNFFPEYLGVFLYKNDLKEKYREAWNEIISLEGQIDERMMTRLNAKVDVDKQHVSNVAADYLNVKRPKVVAATTLEAKVWKRTKEHLVLVGFAISISILFGVPLGILTAKNNFLGQVILNVSGIFQTIPSLALLAFLIPIFGIGNLPAMVALVLYGLLPVIINTSTGLISVEPKYREVAQSLGLSNYQSLKLIEIPIALPSILAGIKTSLVIGIGTATLAALIGAGGYGVPIMTGIALNDSYSILEGAIPAAVLAIIASILFGLISRFLIPKGLRSK